MERKENLSPSLSRYLLTSYDETSNGVEIDPLGSEDIAGLSTKVLLQDNLLGRVVTRLNTEERSYLLIDFEKTQMNKLHRMLHSL